MYFPLTVCINKEEKSSSGPLKVIFDWLVIPSWNVNPKKFEIGQANIRKDNNVKKTEILLELVAVWF